MGVLRTAKIKVILLQFHLNLDFLARFSKGKSFRPFIRLSVCLSRL